MDASGKYGLVTGENGKRRAQIYVYLCVCVCIYVYISFFSNRTILIYNTVPPLPPF